MPLMCLMSAADSGGLSSGSGLNWVLALYTIRVALKGESWHFLGVEEGCNVFLHGESAGVHGVVPGKVDAGI